MTITTTDRARTDGYDDGFDGGRKVGAREALEAIRARSSQPGMSRSSRLRKRWSFTRRVFARLSGQVQILVSFQLLPLSLDRGPDPIGVHR
jgi:hypothetical protein